ncbi:putative serine esterase-domain-containing protein [Scleroderma yunnanense]
MANLHLLVLIHGMWGNPAHLTRMQEIIQQTMGAIENSGSEPIELVVLVAQTNRDEWTYDGIDWGGERVAEEVMNEVMKYEKQGRRVTRFSVMGYSMGGLIARYVIGILHQNRFFETVTPVNFNTIATPHIGIPNFRTAQSSIRSFFGRNFLSRTGEQFYCADKWSPKGRTLIEVLGDPEYIFYQALLLFPNIGVYANAINDHTVPYITAAIELTDPFTEYQKNDIKIEFLGNYEHVIKSYSAPDSPGPLSTNARLSLLARIASAVPPIPPAFQYTFPVNIIIYPLLPFLIPAFLSLLVIRFSISSKKSRTRLQILEADLARERLSHIIAKLEREIETATLDAYENPELLLSLGPVSRGSGPEQLVPKAGTIPALETSSHSISYLTPGQLKCIENLNKIAWLKKTLVFFADVDNSHPVIVCRDVKSEHHRKGEAVLRHWADHFEL